METYETSDNKWAATIWIIREFYYAEGKNEEEAITNLKNHLVNLIPIYENDIEISQDKIKTIKEITSGQDY